MAAVMVAMLTGISVPAHAAFCIEPKAPSLLFIRKPMKPYCATDRSCDQWEVDAYKSEVSRYFSQLKQYAADVDEYYKDAAEYVGCMSKLD